MADASAPPDDALFAAIHARLEQAPGLRAEGGDRVAVLLAEVRPFVEAAWRAERDGGDAALWGEARSLAWLFAYRMGDQGYAGLVVAAALAAWRDAADSEWVRRAADEATALLLDGYARGREDHARTEAQRALADALPVAAVAPGAVLIVAAGPLDPEGARALADRAGAVMLRSDARAALLDVGGLVAPSAAVMAELWAVASAARMLGVRMVVSGTGAELVAALEGAGVPDEGVLRAESLTAGVELLLREAGEAPGGARKFTAWVRGLLTGARGAHRAPR